MKNVLEWLEITSARLPNKTAFISEDEVRVEVTFEEIENKSKAIGSILADEECDTPIGVFSARTATTPILFLSCVYANRAYAPIDVALPEARIGKILDNLKPTVILVDSESFDSFVKVAKDVLNNPCDVIMVDFDKNEISKYACANYDDKVFVKTISNDLINQDKLDVIRKEMKPSDALYIIHTSGSSGRPKGVVTSHESLITYIDAYSKVMNINEDDCFGNQSPLDYIAAIRDIYLPLKFGAHTSIIPKKYFMDPNSLFKYLNEMKVTCVGWSVSALTVPLSLGAFEEESLDTLKKICFSGSVMPCSALRVWQENLKDALFVNQYGPTEATASCTYYVVDHVVEDDEVLPIGNQYDGYEVFLLSLEGESKIIKEENVEGQICVSGKPLAICYYNDEERTSQSFVFEQIDGVKKRIYKTGDIGSYSNGMLNFHGRMDRQIKHMGHRVELDEVECAANSVDNVTESCCIYKKEKESLFLFYSGETSKRELSLALRELIPGFMVPRKIIQLDSLPKLPNGKIDIKKLEEM